MKKAIFVSKNKKLRIKNVEIMYEHARNSGSVEIGIGNLASQSQSSRTETILSVSQSDEYTTAL